MPYITKTNKDQLYNDLEEQSLDLAPNTPGELNYLITRFAINYAETKGINYTTLNEVMGVFASASAEFYRRKVAPYENAKIDENGDVY